MLPKMTRENDMSLTFWIAVQGKTMRFFLSFAEAEYFARQYLGDGAEVKSKVIWDRLELCELLNRNKHA